VVPFFLFFLVRMSLNITRLKITALNIGIAGASLGSAITVLNQMANFPSHELAA